MIQSILINDLGAYIKSIFYMISGIYKGARECVGARYPPRQFLNVMFRRESSKICKNNCLYS